MESIHLYTYIVHSSWIYVNLIHAIAQSANSPAHCHNHLQPLEGKPKSWWKLLEHLLIAFFELQAFELNTRQEASYGSFRSSWRCFWLLQSTAIWFCKMTFVKHDSRHELVVDYCVDWHWRWPLRKQWGRRLGGRHDVGGVVKERHPLDPRDKTSFF